jgi:plastocyanin
VYLLQEPVTKEAVVSKRAITILLLSAVSAALTVLTPSAAAGGGCHSSAPASVARGEGENVTVDIGECAFSPTIVYIEEGTTVTWDNFDPMPHTVTGVAMSLHGEDYIEANETPVSYRFDETGVYPYYCILHAGMAAAVVVGDVGAEKASADKIQAAPVAVYEGNASDNEPPASNTAPVGDDAPAWPALTAGAVAALAVLALGVMWRRRHPEIVAPQEGSPVGS